MRACDSAEIHDKKGQLIYSDSSVLARRWGGGGSAKVQGEALGYVLNELWWWFHEPIQMSKGIKFKYLVSCISITLQ